MKKKIINQNITLKREIHIDSLQVFRLCPIVSQREHFKMRLTRDASSVRIRFFFGRPDGRRVRGGNVGDKDEGKISV